MKQFYTVFFIRNSDQKLLKRFSSRALNLFYWKKEVEKNLNGVLDKFDLQKNEVTVREYNGTVDSYED